MEQKSRLWVHMEKTWKTGLEMPKAEPLGCLILISFHSNKPCEPSVDKTLDQRLKT